MIPKKIHYCWLSGDPYPALIAHCMASWHKHLPDYEFVLWDKEKAKDIMQVAWVKEAYTNKKYAFATDYIRLYALYTEGGIYLDTDVEVVKDLSPLLKYQSFMGHETTVGDFEPAVIGAHKKMEWIKKCLEYYNGRHFCKYDGALDMLPLPIIVERVLSENYQVAKDYTQISTIENIGLTLHPSDYFSPKSIYIKKIKISPNTYTIHHFNENWIKKDFVYYIKKIIHKSIITCVGQNRHNNIIRKIRYLIKK